MQLVRAGLAGVLDEPTARVAVLRGIGGVDHLHLANALDRRRTLVRLLVAFGKAERRAIEEVLRGHRLAAVDPRVELAALEHRIAVRRHRGVSGLEQQERLRQADVPAHDYGKVLVVLLVNGVSQVALLGGDHFRGGDHLYRLRDVTEFEGGVLTENLTADQDDAGSPECLEPGTLHAHGVGA